MVAWHKSWEQSSKDQPRYDLLVHTDGFKKMGTVITKVNLRHESQRMPISIANPAGSKRTFNSSVIANSQACLLAREENISAVASAASQVRTAAHWFKTVKVVLQWLRLEFLALVSKLILSKPIRLVPYRMT